MNTHLQRRKTFLSLFLVWSVLLGAVPTRAQDLVPVSDITGGSSVFVFRNSRKSAPRKFLSVTKPKRTVAQRVETVKKVSKQFVAIAKVTPRRARTKAVDPNNLPPAARTMPAAEASKLFAGVGEYYMDRTDADNATTFFRESATLDAKNKSAQMGLSEALALKGNDLLVRGDAKTSRANFEEAIKLNPKNAVAYYGLGEILNGLDKDDEAIANYEKALAYDKDLTEIYVPLGILYYQKGEVAKADEFLTKARTAAADSGETQYFTGLVRYSQNRNQEALTAFRQALKADPDYAEARYHTGETLARLDQNAAAIAEYNEALRLKPKYFEAQFAKGAVSYELENYPEAIKSFEEARRLKNDDAAVYINLADAYRQNKKFNDAESNYNLAAVFMERGKNYTKEEIADVYSYAGYVIGRQCEINLTKAVPCRWSVAIQNLEKAVALSPSASDYANLGWAYYNAGKLDLSAKRTAEGRAKLEKAKMNLQKSIALNPKFIEAPLLNLGTTLIDLGDYPGAINALRQVSERRSDWPFVNYALGVAYRKNNDYDSAIKYFRKALDKDDKYVAALAGLGESEYRKGNKKETEKIIQRLKKLNPNEAKKLEILMMGATFGY